MMCICVNCAFVDRCTTYYAVEEQHQQPHLTDEPSFEPDQPTINVNIRTFGEEIQLEWDVIGCASFQLEAGRWSRLRPGELIPT
ncbi:putative protein [Synechococcus sp. PCC 6312]|nr:putative protein [Synechococcus sp. PCC 6312]